MKISSQQVEKSRLGRLLVNRGYISEVQLEQALTQQRASGQRLGEVLIAAGWVKDRDIERALNRQRRYRYAAAAVAAVVAPLQPVLSFAAVTPAAGALPQVTSTQRSGGLQAMTDAEMGSVTGQGIVEFLSQVEQVKEMASNQQEPDAVEVLKVVGKTFVPVFNLLDSDVTIEGVHYDDTKPRYEIQDNGHLQLALPERIESISMNNIRVMGSQGPSMGDITMTDIRFHPDSKLVIYAR